MQKRIFTGVTISILVLAMIGFGVNAFAWRGQGYHRGQGMMQNYQNMQNYPTNLTEEQIKAIESERQSFYTQTQDIRQQMYEKRLELMSVMSKKEPDVEKAKSLQKELSTLQSQFDEKRIDHMIQMKKICPTFEGNQMGYGNCPYGMGQGMGYGHMGPGMGYGHMGW